MPEPLRLEYEIEGQYTGRFVVEAQGPHSIGGAILGEHLAAVMIEHDDDGERCQYGLDVSEARQLRDWLTSWLNERGG